MAPLAFRLDPSAPPPSDLCGMMPETTEQEVQSALAEKLAEPSDLAQFLMTILTSGILIFLWDVDYKKLKN